MYEGLKFMNGGKFSTKGEWCHHDRSIDSTEIIIVTEGEVKMFVGDEKYSLSAGDVLKILPGARHGGYEKTVGVSFFWLHFTLPSPLTDLPVAFRPENPDRVALLSKELLHYCESEGYPEDCTDAMMRVLLYELCHRSRDGGKLVSEIKEWIRWNRNISVTAQAVAEHFGYNEDYLNRMFRKSVGRGLKKYITDTRLTMIKNDLLVGAETLGELSEKYGFSEYKYFLKFFKYHEGISPANYRRTYYNLHTN